MVVTCRLVEVEEAEENKKDPRVSPKVKGTGTCANCGNEADMWVDLESSS